MGKIAFRLLNLEVTERTYTTLYAHGMDRTQKATIATILDMALSQELEILPGASDRQHCAWEEWAARLLALYRMHVTPKPSSNDLAAFSLHALLEPFDRVSPAKLPLTRSDFDLLSFSAEISTAIRDCAKADQGSMLRCAFAAELDSCAPQFNRLAELALKASQKLAA